MEVPVKKLMMVAMAFLFVFVGMQHVAQADETKAAVEDMKGKSEREYSEGQGGSESPNRRGQRK